MATKSTIKASPVKTRSSGSSAAKAPAPSQPSQDEIAARAFEIYEREGGSDLENWLRAERELMARGQR
jgi:hypothetical protein